MFKKIRIFALLLVLFIVGMSAWREQAQATSWEHSLNLVVYPINGDGSDVSARYIAELTPARFDTLTEFFSTQATRYDVRLAYGQAPVRVHVAPAVSERPPPPPTSANPLSVGFWSLKMRYWAWKHGDHGTGPGQIRMFVLYHDPALNPRLAHSLGLEKGLIGVVNAFASADMDGRNAVVVAHELLHTVGARDRYDPATAVPLYPEGYAEPERVPLHPQSRAEIMGGRIPRSYTEADMPDSLRDVVIGAQTAAEIGWSE